MLVIRSLRNSIQRVAKEMLPVKVNLVKANNRNNRKRCEICSKLTIKTPERC